VWAAEANTIPAAFWTLIHLLEHPHIMHQVVGEIDGLYTTETDTMRHTERERQRCMYSRLLIQHAVDIVAQRPSQSPIQAAEIYFTEQELSSMTLLKNAIEETIRLHSPPILVRGVKEDVVIGNFVVWRNGIIE
jgi:cytochrome P450